MRIKGIMASLNKNSYFRHNFVENPVLVNFQFKITLLICFSIKTQRHNELSAFFPQKSVPRWTSNALLVKNVVPDTCKKAVFTLVAKTDTFRD